MLCPQDGQVDQHLILFLGRQIFQILQQLRRSGQGLTGYISAHQLLPADPDGVFSDDFKGNHIHGLEADELPQHIRNGNPALGANDPVQFHSSIPPQEYRPGQWGQSPIQS